MSEPSGGASPPSCAPAEAAAAAAASLEALEALEAELARAPPGGHGFDRVCFPDCLTPGPDGDGGLYPYQRVGFELLRDPAPKNLLVASPTGSGKTRLIEACVALARERGERVFVAEPLIALVEQIYARLGGAGSEDLCMLTGPARKGDAERASVTVCTYEVLARLAAQEPERLDGCPRLVLDEFHFLGSERGPVLQEILAHAAAPHRRSVVALSGTLPNVADLAAFLSRLNDFPTFVIGAQRRPVDISFHCYCCGSNRLAPLPPPPRRQVFRAQAIGGLGDRQSLLRLLAQLDRQACHPSLLVAFSCRRLDELADWAAAAAPAPDRAARRLVATGFARLLRGVPAEDRALFALYRFWADRGVGVHHSHAPPPYLELVSWLAERRALRLVFSSSTLSAGINLPVRTLCLLSARVPRRGGDGGLAHEDIDPLLFHQLVGRAGRPGYEREGHCVLLVKNEADRPAAQALMQLPLPAVLPPSGFAAGDALRALRDRRCLLSEIQALASPEEHGLALRAARDAALQDAALALLGDDAAAKSLVRRQVEAAHLLLAAPAALLPYARVAAPQPRELLLQPDGGVVVRAAPPAAAAAVAPVGGRLVPLTQARRGAATRLPWEDVDRLLELQQAARALLEAPPGQADPALYARVLSVCFRCRASQRALANSPLHEEFARAARALEGWAVRGGELTPQGRAACEIRTCREPHRVLERLLALGELDAPRALAFASQVLQEGGGAGAGDGSRRVEPDGLLPVLLLEADAMLALVAPGLAGFETTHRDWTAAVLCWSYGAALADLKQLLPVGSFCRHITRVADCCEELAAALRELGADPAAFEAARRSVVRGLPFLRRGGWKAEPADEEEADEEEEEADDGGAAAAAAFEAVFGGGEEEEQQQDL